MLKIAPGNFFEPSDEPVITKQRTIKKPTQKSRGLVYCMARLEGFEPPTARFVAEYSIQLSYRRLGGARILKTKPQIVNVKMAESEG